MEKMEKKMEAAIMCYVDLEASRWLRRGKERAGKHHGAHYIVGGLYRL